MLLEFQIVFPGLINIMDSDYRWWVGEWAVGTDGEPKAGSSIHLNRKTAIVYSLKCTDSHSLLVRLIWLLAAF